MKNQLKNHPKSLSKRTNLKASECEHEGEEDEQQFIPMPFPEGLLPDMIVNDDNNTMIVLEQEINKKVAMDFIFRSLDAVYNLPEGKPLLIGINSPGGCYNSSMMIVDFIKSLKCETVCFNLCQAASGAALIMLACDKRIAFPNSLTMLHEVQIIETGGTVGMIDNHLTDLKKMNKVMINMISSRSNLSVTQIKKKFKDKKDWYLSSKEAKKHGVVDKVSADLLKYLT